MSLKYEMTVYKIINCLFRLYRYHVMAAINRDVYCVCGTIMKKSIVEPGFYNIYKLIARGRVI